MATKENPELTNVIRPEDVYRPEVVFSIGEPEKDANGWAHFMQVHPDKTSDYISYKPEEFDHGSRWFCINKDKQALGLLLPATADSEGYTAEKKKGNIKEIGPKGTKNFRLCTGYLSIQETAEMEDKIGQIIAKKV
jgi:hypothetical protein